MCRGALVRLAALLRPPRARVGSIPFLALSLALPLRNWLAPLFFGPCKVTGISAMCMMILRQPIYIFVAAVSGVWLRWSLVFFSKYISCEGKMHEPTGRTDKKKQDKCKDMVQRPVSAVWRQTLRPPPNAWPCHAWGDEGKKRCLGE